MPTNVLTQITEVAWNKTLEIQVNIGMAQYTSVAKQLIDSEETNVAVK